MEPEPERDDAWVYQIKVEGQLSQSWSGWFNGLALTCENETADGPAVITLTGQVVDQAALRGLLKKIWDLNLVIISVSRMAEATK